jgi:hypothetical protein
MPNLPSQARADFDTLLETLMPFAEQMLNKHGEFYPFGAAVNAQGEVVSVSPEEETEMPASEEVIQSLTRRLDTEARAGNARATGICYNGRIVQEGKEIDAIICTLEHESGEASKTYVPYKKGLFGKYKLGDISASQAEPQIFAKP